MKSELPFRRCFPADLLTDRDIARMSWADRGLLQAIEARYWLDGDLSADPGEVARLIGARDADIPAITRLLDSRFPIRDQVRRSAGLDAEREAAARLRDSYAERGKKGGHKGEKKAQLKAQPQADGKAELKAQPKAEGKAVRSQSQSHNQSHNAETESAAAGAADVPPAPWPAGVYDSRVRMALEDSLNEIDRNTIIRAVQKSPLSGKLKQAIQADVLAQLALGNPRPADRTVEALRAMLMLGAKVVPGIFEEFLKSSEMGPLARAV